VLFLIIFSIVNRAPIGFIVAIVVGSTFIAYFNLFRVVVELRTEAGRLRWRAPLATGSLSLSSIKALRPGWWTGAVLEAKERQRIPILVARGLDEVAEALQERIPGFTYDFTAFSRIAMWLSFVRWQIRYV
jgi:hypothetical protein